MEIITDIVLRAHWFKTHSSEYVVGKDILLTPAAKDFIKEHQIQLVCREDTDKPADGCQKMTVIPIEKDCDGKPVFIDEATKEKMSVKPEYMTHLYGNHLVPKTDKRIVFRGKLDSLEADIMRVQILAKQKEAKVLVNQLSEILSFVRSILRAEVLSEPVPKIKLLNLDSDELRYESHHVKEIYGISHPTPEYTMGALCMALNQLRTKVRETELCAASAFIKDETCMRPDILEALNRLSSCVYLLFLRALTQTKPAQPSAPDGRSKKKPVPVEASGRHVHLTREAMLALFGKEQMTKKSDLSQPGQFAAQERVTLMTSKGTLERVAVLGPVRDEVQVEISLTDAKILGIDVPVNLSGDLSGAADVIIVGPEGIYNAVGSVIAAKAHIHMTPEDARHFGVEDKDIVSVRLESRRPVTIEEVLVRVSDKFALAMHLDYDEANAAQFKKGDLGYIIGGERPYEHE